MFTEVQPNPRRGSGSFLDQSHPGTLNICLKNLLPKYLTVQSILQPPNFNNLAVHTSEDYFNLTGLHKEQFQDLASLLPSLHKSKDLLQLFERHSRMTFRPYILDLDIFLTMSSAEVTRSPLHKSCLGQTLVMFGTNIGDVITVLDGTYIFIQKSAGYSFQRRVTIAAVQRGNTIGLLFSK